MEAGPPDSLPAQFYKLFHEKEAHRAPGTRGSWALSPVSFVPHLSKSENTKIRKSKNPKIPESQNPKIPKSQNPKTEIFYF